MKNNHAILNYTEKKINFKFKDEEFIMDLTEGDDTDNWNAFVTSDGVERDLNFSIDDLEYKPYLTVYELRDNGDGTWSTDTFSGNEIRIKFSEVVGCVGEYLGIPFDGIKTAYFEVVDVDGTVFLKTKRFNKACDIASINKMDFICIDVYGNRKLLNPKK